MKRYIRSSISDDDTYSGLEVTPSEIDSAKFERLYTAGEVKYMMNAGIGSGYDGSGPVVSAIIEQVGNARFKIKYTIRSSPHSDWIPGDRIYLGLTTAEANAKRLLKEELDRLFPEWR